MSRERLIAHAAHALVWSIALVYLSGHIATYDLWAYLSQGKLIWETGAVPRADTDSYLPTGPWVCHNWLVSALTYPLFMAGGGAAARGLTLALMVGTLALAYRAARLHGASALVTLLVVALAIPSFSVGAMPFRPAMVSFLFVALLLAWLRCGRAWGWMPALFVLWVNLHAGVLIGLVLLGLWTAASWREPATAKKLAIITTASAAATLINPYHVRYWRMVWEILGDPNKDITEWQPVAWFTNNYPEFQILVFLTLSILLVSRERDPRVWLALALLAFAGARQIRQIPLFAIGVATLLPPAVERWMAGLRRRWPGVEMPLLKRAVPVGALALAALVFGLWLRSEPWRLRVPGRPNPGGLYYPVGGVEFLKRNGLGGNLALYFPWGEYAAWKLHGQCRVSADGRHVTVFTRDAVDCSFDFSLGREGWQRLLTNYPTDYALVPRDWPREKELVDSLKWKQLYTDRGCALYARPERTRGSFALPASADEGVFP
ncbi:MAG: hypothetical protein N2689_04660 [Verrucomicrobiae bacterium]|nr:hypothetical protein [Verrucomicrobiae bacterium]